MYVNCIIPVLAFLEAYITPENRTTKLATELLASALALCSPLVGHCRCEAQEVRL